MASGEDTRASAAGSVTPVPPGCVREELERVLAAGPFRSAVSLGRLLTFLVEETLAGRGGRLKEYVLGVEVFGRGESFDPRVDSIVRVEASRLRSRLVEYYRANGGSRVTIELPRGRYVPQFVAGEAAADRSLDSPDEAVAVPAARPRLRRAALAAAIGGAATLSWIATSALDGWRLEPSLPATVAVLPFVSDGPEREDEYFSAGIAGEIARKLARAPGVRVVSADSTSPLPGAGEGLHAAGRPLEADSVVRVAVRRAGDRLRVSVRLVRAGDGAELWAESREGRADDVVAIEEELARAITGAVGSSLPAAPARRSRAVSAEAHELLLKARYLAISADTAPAIIGYYQAALARDPGFAPAYVGMADTWLRLAVAGEVAPRSVMEKAREAVDRALAIDDGEAAAHFVKAMILWHYAWRWEEADLEFRRALALDPDSTKPRVHYADYLASMDRLPEALEQAGRLSALDPVPAGVRAVEASVYYVSRDYDRTIRHCEAILAADTGAWPLYYWLGRAYGSKGRYEEAIRALEKWRAVPKGRQGRGFGMLGAMYAYAGRRDDALALLEEVERRSLRTYVSPVSISGVYMALGETDRAFAWLDRAYAERDPALVNLRVEPSFDPLRGHARFQALVRRLGFP